MEMMLAIVACYGKLYCFSCSFVRPTPTRRYCWYHYPYHYFDRGVWWYYMVELSFYWSLLGSQFYDVKRKDFWYVCKSSL